MGGGWSQLQEGEESAAAGERMSNQPSQQQLLRENGQRVGEEAKPSNQQQQVVLEEGKPSNQRPRQENKQLPQKVEEGKPSNQRSRQENKQPLQVVEEAGKLSNQQSQRENEQPLQVVEEGKSNLQRGQSKKLPHNNYHAIIKEADTAPLTDPHQIKSGGVFLNQNRKKHWIEEKTGANCFMLYARELSIAWADTPRHWSWSSVKETSNVDVEVANLVNVCWLEVDGKFDTSNLTPNTAYEVAFVVMIDDPAYGWNEPVTLKLVCPDGKVQERKEGLKQKPRGEWMEVHAGDFRTSVEKGGEIQFTLLNYNSDWKRGLVVKGAVIRPNKKSG